MTATPAPDRAIPILPSRSVAGTVEFYRALGFAGGAHPADPGYAILRRGEVELHFFSHSGLVPAESSAMCYLRVGDVAEWYRAFSAAGLPERGIPRLTAPARMPWGLTEFALVDPDGSLIRVGQETPVN